MPAPSKRLIYDAIATRLLTVTHAKGYFGQIGRGLDGELGDEPQPKSSEDQRVEPYFVLYPGTGTDGPEDDLGDSFVDATLPFQITVAGGDVADVLALADRIEAAIHRWAPTVTDVVCGPVRRQPGFAPGPVLVDRQQNPERLYVPLLLQLVAHT